MKTREEVARFIETTQTGVAIPDMDLYNRRRGDGQKAAWHYGLCELRQLMDFIYGGPPENKEQEVKFINGSKEW